MKNFYFNKMSILFFILIVYFTIHLISGKNSIKELYRYKNELSQINIELNEEKQNNIALLKKINLLKSETDGADLLEEQKKKMLGLASPQEAVIFYDIEEYIY